VSSILQVVASARLVANGRVVEITETSPWDDWPVGTRLRVVGNDFAGDNIGWLGPLKPGRRRRSRAGGA